MIIECGGCTGHPVPCGDCLVRALLDAPPADARLTADEQRAIEAFSWAGFDVQVLDDTSDSPPPTPIPVASLPPTPIPVAPLPPTPIPVAPLPSMPSLPASRPRSRQRARRPRQAA